MKKRYILIAIVFFLVLACVLLYLLMSKKPTSKSGQQTYACSLSNCLTGCCTGTICQKKNANIADFTCIGANKWAGSDGTVVIGAPKQVIDASLSSGSIQPTIQVSTPILSTIDVSIIPTGQPASIAEDFTSTFLSVAEKSLACLDKMRDSRGAYLFDRKCSLPDTCEDSTGNNHSSPRPIWARYEHFLRTQDNKDLEMIDKDLTVNINKIPLIQNDFWNCKLMYDIWKNPNLDTALKDKAKQVCIHGQIDNELLDGVDTQIRERKPPVPDFNRYQQMILDNQLARQNILLLEENLLNASLYTSESVNKYSMTRDENELNRAIFFFNQALNIYINKKLDPNYKDYKDVCTLGEATLDLYKASNNNAYLDFAKFLSEREENNFYKSYSTKPVCAFFSNSLYQITNEETYRLNRDNLLFSLIKKNFDSSTYDGYFSGDGCFNSDKTEGSYYKFSNENGLITGLLFTAP